MKINLHTHHQNQQEGVWAIVNQYPSNINLNLDLFSVGIHPWYIDEATVEEELKKIEVVLLSNPNCVAIGECGLDKKVTIPFELQLKVFRAQLVLAEKYKKAVILHVVSAYQEIIALKREMKISVPLIVHGFSKNEQVAESLYKNGFYLSFGKALILHNRMRAVLQTIPIERIFLETDDATDVSIAQVYDIAATVIPGIDEVVRHNFKQVFNR